MLLALALGVRIAVAVAAADVPLTSDPTDFDRHARSIAAGDWYPESSVVPDGGPTAIRPPAYPLVLGAVYALTDDSTSAGRLAQGVLGTVVVALIGVLAAQLWGRRAGLVSLGIAAVYPPLIVFGGTLLTEPLFLTLMLTAANAALRYRATSNLPWLVLTGVAAGLAILTRENGAVLLIPLAMAVWGRRPWMSLRAAAAPALLLGCAVLVVAPWTIRNAVTLDAFVPVTTTAPFTLAGTYNETARRDPSYPAAWRPPNLDPSYAEIAAERGASETAVGDRLGEAVKDFIAADPLYILEVGYHNARRLFHLDGLDWGRRSVAGTTGFGRSAADLATLSFLLCAGLALVGGWTRDARIAPVFIWMMPTFLLLSVVFVRGVTRFRIPADPFLILLAALGLIALVDVVRRHLGRAGDRAAEAARSHRPG